MAQVIPYWAAITISLFSTGALLLLSSLFLFLTGLSLKLTRLVYTQSVKRGVHSKTQPYVIRNPETRDLDVGVGVGVGDKTEEDWEVYRRQVGCVLTYQ